MMKNLYTLLAISLLLSACAGAPETAPSGDYELRSATPGIVDHAVIPKK